MTVTLGLTRLSRPVSIGDWHVINQIMVVAFLLMPRKFKVKLSQARVGISRGIERVLKTIATNILYRM